MVNSFNVVEDILKTIANEHKYDNGNINIKQITSGGANYTSYIFIATISSAEKEDLKLFIKVAAMGSKFREIAENFYENEAFFYTDFINHYKYLEEKHAVPGVHRLYTAKYYGSRMEHGYESLVLEDLGARGFQSFDRFKSVTWDQITESIRQLVKFHALSIALSKENPKEYEHAKEKFLFKSANGFYRDIIETIRHRVIEGTNDNMKQRIDTFIQNTLDNKNFHYLYTPIRKEVIIHGDYRPNNLMYKTENDVCRVVPLDLQTLHTGSPTFDLMYLINFGTDNEFRKRFFEASLNYYYEELSAALRRLNINPNKEYSREDFDYELKEILPFTVVYGLCGLLLLTVNEEDIPTDLGNIGPRDFVFAPGKQFREKLNEFIEFYVEMGIIP